jgi:hypothetical protein
MNWMDNEKYVWIVLYLILFFFMFQGVRFLINWLFN